MPAGWEGAGGGIHTRETIKRPLNDDNDNDIDLSLTEIPSDRN